MDNTCEQHERGNEISQITYSEALRAWAARYAKVQLTTDQAERLWFVWCGAIARFNVVSLIRYLKHVIKDDAYWHGKPIPVPNDVSYPLADWCYTLYRSTLHPYMDENDGLCHDGVRALEEARACAGLEELPA